jgi:hypothetical protein
MFVKTLLQQIFSQHGYTLTGDFLSDARFLKFAVLLKNFYDTEWTKKFEFRANTGSQSVPITGGTDKVNFPNVAYNGEFNVYDGTNTWSPHAIVGSSLRTLGSKFMAMNFRCDMNVTVTGGTARFLIQPVEGAASPFDVTQQDVSASNVNVLLGNTDMDSGKDQSTSSHDHFISVSSVSGTPVVTVNYGTFFCKTATSNKSVASYVNAAKNVTSAALPEFDIAEFIKEVSTFFGLVYISKPGNVIEVKTIKSILTNRRDSKDWTDKFIESKSKEFRSSTVGQINEYKFDADEGLSLGEGSQIFTVNNDFLPNKITYTSAFKIVTTINQVVQATTRKLSAIEVSYYDEATSVYVGEIEDTFCYIRNDRESVEVRLNFNGAFRLYSVAYINDKDFEYNHNWKDYLDEYYFEYIQVLQTGVRIENAIMWLTENDIQEHNQSDQILIDGVYYLVQQIKKFIPGIKTEVELVKIL